MNAWKGAFTLLFMISRNFSEIEPSRKSIEWKEPFFPLSPACCQNNGKCFFKGSLTYHISSWTTSGLGYKNQRRRTGGSWQKILTFSIKKPMASKETCLEPSKEKFQFVFSNLWWLQKVLLEVKEGLCNKQLQKKGTQACEWQTLKLKYSETFLSFTLIIFRRRANGIFQSKLSVLDLHVDGQNNRKIKSER